MRKLAIFISVFWVHLSAFGFDSQWFFTDFTQSPVGVRQVFVTPLWNVTASGTNIAIGSQRTPKQTSAGALTISNMIAGGYRVEFVGQTFTNVFTNVFGTNVTGLVNAKDYISASIAISGTTVAYSQAQSDARFLQRTNGSGAGLTLGGTNTIFAISLGGETRTNWPAGGESFFIGSTYILWDTTGGSNRFSLTSLPWSIITNAPDFEPAGAADGTNTALIARLDATNTIIQAQLAGKVDELNGFATNTIMWGPTLRTTNDHQLVTFTNYDNTDSINAFGGFYFPRAHKNGIIWGSSLSSIFHDTNHVGSFENHEMHVTTRGDLSVNIGQGGGGGRIQLGSSGGKGMEITAQYSDPGTNGWAGMSAPLTFAIRDYTNGLFIHRPQIVGYVNTDGVPHLGFFVPGLERVGFGTGNSTWDLRFGTNIFDLSPGAISSRALFTHTGNFVVQTNNPNVSAGDMTIDVAGRTVIFGRVSANSGDSTSFIIRDRFANQDFKVVGGLTTIRGDSFQGGRATITNGVMLPTNSISVWPSAPVHPGAAFLANSNGHPFILVSTNGAGGASATWTSTNRLDVAGVVNSTNVLVNPAVLTPTDQTNYTIPLLSGPSGNMATIFLANTNAHLTFTGTNSADFQRTVLFRGFTNAVVSRITFVSPVRTNFNLNVWVTNGTAKIINFYNADTSGTNVFVSDAGRYQ